MVGDEPVDGKRKAENGSQYSQKKRGEKTSVDPVPKAFNCLFFQAFNAF